MARYLLLKGIEGKKRILCTREVQNTIRDSVYRVLVDQIHILGLESLFVIKAETLSSVFGSEYLFKGIRMNIEEIKSTEGIDVCWLEEGAKASENSMDVLIPTIRKEGSEIIITFNPDSEKDPVYHRFVKNPPPDCIPKEINWRDNPFFPDVLRREMEYCRKADYDKYLHIWEGKFKTYSDDCIFKGKVVVEEFETPKDVERFFYGADFGFSVDPTVLVRCFIQDNILYIDQEAYGYGIEVDDLPAFFKKVENDNRWKIVADSERPDTISYLRKQGFNIAGATKGKGSVEEGIQFLRSFDKIIIHPRCTGTAEDFENFRWKRDRVTVEILPVPKEGSDHAPDAVRYALESWITHARKTYKALKHFEPTHQRVY